jgi:LmbE family N-acetylglucosaminyl deacetylase
VIHLPLNGLQSILAIGSHPDDIEIGCGGTLLRLLAEQSLHVHWVVLSGAGQRADEAKSGAERFLRQAKSRQVTIEDFRDAFFPANYAEIKEYFLQLRQDISPDVIFTHRREDLHQDHRLVAELTWNTFRDHLIFEYEIPKYEGDLGQPNVYMALDEAQCASKVSAIMESFPSQHGKSLFAEDIFWSMMRIRGVGAGPNTKYAEAFECRKMEL